MAESQPASGASPERRVQWIASLTLGGVLAAHVLLETGRDALFLANIPAERLPWVYLAGALLALTVVRLAGATTGGVSRTRRVSGFLGLAAVAAVVFFWWTTVSTTTWVYYALYVFSGVMTGVTLVSFWLLMGDHFTLVEAKQRFAGITLGGSIGAVLGAGLAALVAPLVPPAGLLLLAGALFAASAAGPLCLPPAPPAEDPGIDAPGAESVDAWSGLREMVTHPYARRVALGVAMASLTMTVADYVFKSVAAEQVAADGLAEWFARVYLGLNLLSIVVLAIGVRPLISRLGVDRSLVLLPALVAAMSVGILFGAPLLFATALKVGGDTLRHSVHKTASEILYLPMEPALRSAVKGVIDGVAHHAARAVAALAILGLTLLPDSRPWVLVTLVGLGLAWALLALRLRGPYLEVFRRTLRHGSIETRIELPELDLDAVGPLLRALSAPDPRTVIGAIELLHEQDRCSLIPPLILYHPAPDVVVRAIDLFAATGREELLDFSDHLLHHEYAAVRSAIVRARSLLAPDRDWLEEQLRSECPSVRASAAAGLLGQGWISPDQALVELRQAACHEEPDTRRAVALVAKISYEPAYAELLADLAQDDDVGVASVAIRAMERSGDPVHTKVLVALLGRRGVRDLVRDALLARGEPALLELGRALRDPSTEIAVLRHVPRTLSRFPTRQSVPVLLAALGEVRSGMVRYKILRGLESLTIERRLQREEREGVERVLRATVLRAVALLRFEAALEQPAGSQRTDGGELLLDLVRDKQQLARGRMLLLVALLYPEENVARIRAGVRSDRGRRQSSGIELLENLLPADLRPAVRGLLSPGRVRDRLRVATGRNGSGLGYERAVRQLARDDSEAVRAFAMYHASEISLALGRGPDDEEEDGLESGRFESLRAVSLSLLERLPDAVSRRAFGSGPVVAG